MHLSTIASTMLPLALIASPALAAEPAPSRIVVEGFGTVETPPDIAAISYSVRGEGASSDAATAAMVTAQAKVEAAITGFTTSADIKSGKDKIDAVRGKDCNDDDNPRLSAGACAIIGYIVQMPITLRTADLKDAGTIVGLIGREGGYNPRLDAFTLSHEAAAKRRAIASAIADAHSQAEAMAEAAHLHLGRVITISNSYDSEGNGADEIVVTAQHNPPPAVMAPPPIAIHLTPQPIETTAKLTVAYEILP